MKRLSLFIAIAAILGGLAACKAKSGGNGYKIYFKELRSNTSPAVGFKIDVWVKGKSEPRTITTNEKGEATLTDLPQPDATHPVNANWRYFRGKKDQTREISYPYIESDKERMKDTQYIPNDATPDPA